MSCHSCIHYAPTNNIRSAYLYVAASWQNDEKRPKFQTRLNKHFSYCIENCILRHNPSSYPIRLYTYVLGLTDDYTEKHPAKLFDDVLPDDGRHR